MVALLIFYMKEKGKVYHKIAEKIGNKEKSDNGSSSN
jgi:hypothetical protein